MREINVATVQMQPELGQMEDNLIKMSEFITRVATEQPVDLIIFPELITTGYELGAFGMVSKEKVESIVYNTAILVGPDGDIIGQYNKVHLQGEERISFRPGHRLAVFETTFGNVGLIIGWDLAFPEVARSLVLEGAELLVACANWAQPNADEWRTYLLARAFENAVFVAAANRVGEEPSYTFFGQSGIIGPRGKVYASVGEPTEGYAVARIDLDEVRQHREDTQVLQCRQPTTYRAIVKKY